MTRNFFFKHNIYRLQLLLVFILIFFSFFIFSNFVFSYNDTDTHPDLTVEIVNFFNAKALKKELGTWSLELGKEETEWIRQGSILEDTSPRWINHFYNPETGEGWTAKNLEGISQDKLQYFSEKFLSYEPPVSSLNWSQNQELQNKYSFYQGNRTWQKAIYDYATGNKKQGLLSLGFILHLIEDASVPEHTRDDTHADISFLNEQSDKGSPYENWAKAFTLANQLNIANKLNQENKKPEQCDTLAQCLIKLAEYSHYNFFSEDTIFGLKEPKIAYFKEVDDLIIGYSDTDNPLVFRKLDKDGKEFFTLFNKNSNPILSSYFSHLSQQAVLTGAGVIDLFFAEVEKAKNDPQYLSSLKLEQEKQEFSLQSSLRRANLPLMSIVMEFLSENLVSPTGEFFRAEKMFVQVQTSVSKIASFIKTSLTPKAVLEKSGQPALTVGDPVANNQLTELTEMTPPSVPSLGVQQNEQQNENEVSFQIQPQIQNQDQNQNILNPTQNNRENQNLKISSSNSGEDAPNLDVGHPSLEENSADLVSSANQVSANQSVSLFQPLTSPSPGFGGGAVFVQNNQENQNSTSTPEQEEPAPDTTPPNTPTITSPTNFSQTFTTYQIAFQGTAEASSTLQAVYLLNSATTTATTTAINNQNLELGAWNLVLFLNQGTTTIDFSSIDAAANQSSSTSVSLFIDSISPAIGEFKISECANSLSVPGESCLVATTTLNVLWSSSNQDIDFYELSVSGNQFASSSYLQVPSSKFQTLAEGNYTFSLRAKDKSGNWSTATTTQAEISLMPVVINEIAWAGTQASGLDEWLELYNRTSKSINLANWILYSSADFRPYIVLQNSIPARSYYLIERTNASTTDVSEDLTAPFGSGSGAGLEGDKTTNAGEPLYLVYAKNNSTTTIDYVPTCGTQWCAIGSGGSLYRTMERVNPDISGSDSTNWRYNNAIIRNGKATNNQLLNATPKSRNSANYLISNTNYLQENKTLTKSNSPYFIENTLTVQNGKTLTIEPGVVIKFQDAVCCLFIQGTLNALGSPNDYIVFTSFHDDEYGGDLDNNGNLIPPQKGQWFRVELTPTSSSTLSYVKFRYGGGSISGGNPILKVDATYSTISNSVFEYSELYGLELKNSNALVASSTFQFNNNPSQGLSAGLYTEGGSPKILSNVFENNRRGMFLVNTQAEINSNSFASSTSEAVYVVANFGELALFQNNSGSLNGTNGIVFNVLHLQGEATSTLYSNLLLPYVFNGSATITASSTLVIQPNTIIKNSDNYLDVHGKLISQGTNPTDIVFTSLNDCNDCPGEWYRIRAYPGSQISLAGTTIKHAGKSSLGEDSGIYADNANVILDNVVFDNNLKNGLVLKNSISSIKNSEFKNHTSPALDSRGITYYNSTINLENTTFRDNYWGVYADANSVAGTIFGNIFDSNASSTNRAELFPL